MALIDKASLLMVPSVYEDGTLYNVLPSGNKAPDETGNHNGYDQTRADFTFSRGSNLAATRVNADGLIEKGRENLFTQSNNLTHSDWEDGSNTSISSGFVDKDGGTNAFRLTMTSGIGTYFYQTKSLTNGGVYTLSFWAKANGSTHLYTSGDAGYESVPLTNEWQRFEFYFVLSTSSPSIGLDNNAAAVDCLIMNMQLEAGLVATDYIESGSVSGTAGVLENTPRIDYSSGAGALLLEPQRTNLIPNSEYFGSGSGWSLLNNVSVGNFVLSPEGKMNATQIIFDGSIGGRIERTISGLTAGANYSVSVYARVASGTQDVFFGSFEDTPAITLTTEWQRFEKTQPENDTNAYPRIRCEEAATIEIFGFQLEAGSHVSSYVPTYGSAATRGADSCSVTGVSDVIGQTEGTMYLDIQTPDAIQSNTTFSIGGGTSSEYAQLEIRTDLSINWRYRAGGVDYINANVGSYSAGDRLKLAFGYKNGDSILYLNGSSIATDTGSIVSNSWDEVKYSNFAGTGKLEASVKETILFNERLTNSELATLTTL